MNPKNYYFLNQPVTEQPLRFVKHENMFSLKTVNIFTVNIFTSRTILMSDETEMKNQPFLEDLEAPLLSTLSIMFVGLFPIFQLWPMTYLFLRQAQTDIPSVSVR